MTRTLGFLAALSLIACGTTDSSEPATDTGTDTIEDTDAAEDTVEDATTDTTSDAEADTDTDTVETDTEADTDTVEDTDTIEPDADVVEDTPEDTETCEDGDVTQEGCETCYCNEGTWECSEDEWCVYEECIAACPAECVSIEEQPCGSNLGYFCTPCHLECNGVEEVDREVCEDPGSTCGELPPDSESVTYSIWEAPGDCYIDEFGDYASTLFASDSEFHSTVGCDAELGLDWDAGRLILAVFFEGPGAEIRTVATRGDEAVVQMTAPAYCGGPAPTNTSTLVWVEALPTTINVINCTYGSCTGPPAP